jgi:acetolactate synthase-1/2/3 large subunit
MSRISIRLKELPENGENIPEIPAQDRVFQILSKRMMIAAKWARSPTNLKMFIFCNEGYASIRMTQKNYFDGAYLGCDVSSGLGFPDWRTLAAAYRIPSLELAQDWFSDPGFLDLWHSDGPALFLVPLHPEQTYFPKISSRISATGGMESNPLHLMSPDLAPETAAFVMRYFPS